MKIKIEVSARHVHLSQNDMEILFGKNYRLNISKNLSQPGQYACVERVNIIGDKAEIKNVAVLGPCREKTQVEISLTDAIKLGIRGVIRESGNLENTPGCVIQGPAGKVNLTQGVIVAKRHIHMTPKDAEPYNLNDGMICKIKIEEGCRKLILDDVVIRISDKFSLAMHVDTDEANAFGYTKNMFGELIK